MLASSLLTLNVALPLRSRVLLSASVSASTVITSLLPLAVIVVSLLPVLMLMPLSPALPVVTVSVPVRAVASTLPTRLVTTWAAAPLWVRVMFSFNEVAFTVNVSPLVLLVTLIGPEPVVIVAALSVTSA